MDLESLIQQLLAEELTDDTRKLKDCGITLPEQFAGICLALERKEIIIHHSEITPDTHLNDLQDQISKYQFGNAWKARLRPEPVLIPYAGLTNRF